MKSKDIARKQWPVMLEGDKVSKFNERKAWVKSDEKHIKKVMTELIATQVLSSRLWFLYSIFGYFLKRK